MTPNAITLLFKEARDAFPPLEGKPTDDDLLSIRETLLPILMEIPYDQFGGVHSLTAIFEAAERGAAKFLREVVDEVWYNDLKDADTFYTKVTALEIISFLDANSGGLHAIDMISLRTNMHPYYGQADGIPQYIIMLEDAQKKAKRAGMPIADIELVMMASAAVLAAQHFPREVDDWEGLPSTSRTWVAWKTAFRLAHLKRQRQILASGGGNHSVGPTACFLRRLRRSEGWRRHSTTLRSRRRTTLLSSSSSRRLIWLSRQPSPRLLQPTRNWWMRGVAGGLRQRGLHWGRRRKGGGLRRLRTLVTTVGLTAIASAGSTPVPPAPTRRPATATMPLQPTPLAAARRIRAGPRRAPDGGGWRI